MEEQKLVLKDSVVEINFETEQVIVPEEELRKAGYVKLADNELIVIKVPLNEEEARFMQENGRLAFYDLQNIDFEFKANDYAEDHAEHRKDIPQIYERLVKAYFCGYTVRETKYYIKLSFISNSSYLNVYKDDDEWEFGTKRQVYGIQTQFTQTEIEGLRKDEQARGLDLNALKVRVPDNELED